MAVRESYFQAEELAQRAAALEPDNGTAWAVLARASLGMIRHGYETTPQRREEGRKQATRARQLAPQAVDTVLAWGLQLTTSKQAGEAEHFLRETIAQRADDRRVWLLLADGLRSLGKFPEAREIWRRLQAAPGGDVEALNVKPATCISTKCAMERSMPWPGNRWPWRPRARGIGFG